MSENYFTQLNAVNVNDKKEKKGNLTYLSWTYAWGEVKKLHPEATYTVYENADGLNYHTDGKTCWVKTGVTVKGIEHIEYLPILNSRNQSINLKDVTSYDVNKAIQRSITKACARHGLGLYIYSGEDLPEAEDDTPPQAINTRKDSSPRRQPQNPSPAPESEPAAQPQMAAPGQIQFIIDNASDEQYQALMQTYGAELERLTFRTASKAIEKIQKGMNGNA